MSKPRIADVRLVAGLLQEEHPDVDELARTVIERLDEARTERARKEAHKGLIFKAAGVLLTVGPFPTETAMTRWCKANNVEPTSTQVCVVKRPEEV